MAQGPIIGLNVVTVGSHPAARIGVKEVSATEAIFLLGLKACKRDGDRTKKKSPLTWGNAKGTKPKGHALGRATANNIPYQRTMRKPQLHRKFAYWLSIEGGHLETISTTRTFVVETLSQFAEGG